MLHVGKSFRAAAIAASLVIPMLLSAQSRDQKTVAHNLVSAALVAAGDKVLISGGVRDAALMEDIAIETMKAGGEPLIVLNSDALVKRSYSEVPESYDSHQPALSMAMINAFDVQISIDVGETEGLLASVPASRRAARAKAGEPANELYFKKNVRFVNLGNGMYPTATLSRRLGMTQSQLTNVFWRASAVSSGALHSRAATLGSGFTAGKQITMTHANGTNITFAVDQSRSIISDGALTPDKVKQGGAAAATYLPAGELMFPAVAGTANGTVVIDRVLYDGKIIRGLSLTFGAGKLTSMTAASGLAPLQAAYDAAGGAKDAFGYIDIGVNPEITATLGTGRIVWGAPGSVVVGMGDNRGVGGTEVSNFGFAGQLGGATIKVDGKSLIADGVIR